MSLWNFNVLISLSSCLFCCLLGFFVLFKNPHRRLNQFFCGLLVTGGIWALQGVFEHFAIVNNRATFFPIKFSMVTGVFTGYFLVLFSWHFPTENPHLKKSWFWVLTTINAFVLALSFTDIFVDRVKIVDGQYMFTLSFYYKILSLPFFISHVLYSLVNIGLKYRRTPSIQEKLKIKYLFLGYILGFLLGTLGTMWLPLLHITNFIAISTLAPFVGNIPVAYSIIRYRAFEIDTVIHKTILWLVTIVISILPLAVLDVFTKNWFYSWHPGFFVLLHAIELMVFLGYYHKLKPLIDHVFRRRKYDYYKVLGTLGQKVGTELDVERLQERIFKELKEILYINNGILWVEGEKKNEYVVTGLIGYQEQKQAVLHKDHGLGQYMNSWLQVLEKEQLEVNPAHEGIRQEALALCKDLKLEIIIPLLIEGHVKGLLGLGKKENLQAYTTTDIELLSSLGNQLGIVVDNALHHEDIVEKERLAEELKLGREIQINLLPKQAPLVEGIKITGLMEPAKEIGGDYYDYIKISDKSQKLAVVIGDVSGKGVAAGLIMATAKATLEGIVEQGLSPKETLIKANRILYGYTQGEKFMTMLYLVWDSGEKKLRYSSAGHEHIIIYRKQMIDRNTKLAGNAPRHSLSKGNVEVIKSGGVIMGVVPDIEQYIEDRELTLLPGEKVVLYTDGVTEAQNNAGELFSLPRLVDTVQKQGTKGIAEMIMGIKEDVYSHIGKYDQYDDITLVGIEMC